MLVRYAGGHTFRSMFGLALVGALLLSGCSPRGVNDEVAEPEPTTALSPTLEPSSAESPADDVEAEVLSAYLAFWDPVAAASDPPIRITRLWRRRLLSRSSPS